MTHFHLLQSIQNLLCGTSNKGTPRLICKYLTQSVDAEIVYSVGSDCTNLSTQESMPDYSFSQSEADTILISAYAVLFTVQWARCHRLSWHRYIYVAAAAISQKLPGLLCVKRKQATILCHNLVPEEMADCIVPLHCLTGCDANSSRVNSLDIEEEAIEELFCSLALLSVGTRWVGRWEQLKLRSGRQLWRRNRSFASHLVDSLRQHCLRANYLA